MATSGCHSHPVPHPVFRARGRLGGGLGMAAGSVYTALTGTLQPARQIGGAVRVAEVRRQLSAWREARWRGKGGWLWPAR
ncbi:MAG: hypothetical protein ACXVHC_03070, partial [Frankiaceae bacterium]